MTSSCILNKFLSLTLFLSSYISNFFITLFSKVFTPSKLLFSKIVLPKDVISNVSIIFFVDETKEHSSLKYLSIIFLSLLSSITFFPKFLLSHWDSRLSTPSFGYSTLNLASPINSNPLTSFSILHVSSSISNL